MKIEVNLCSYNEQFNNAFVLINKAHDYNGWYYIEEGHSLPEITEFQIYKASHYNDAMGKTHFIKGEYFNTMTHVNMAIGEQPSIYEVLETLKYYLKRRIEQDDYESPLIEYHEGDY